MEHTPLLQFLTFVLFLGLMSILNSVIQRVAAVMDSRVLLGASAHSPLQHVASRPAYSTLMAACMAWFFAVFYRTLFTSMEEITLFLVVIVLNDLSELLMFLTRFQGAHQKALTYLATKARKHRLEARKKDAAVHRHDSAGGPWCLRHGCSSARLLFWHLVCTLVPVVDLEHVRRESAVEYVVRCIALFSSLLTMLFTTAYWRLGSTAYHTNLYQAWTADHEHFEKSLTFLLVGGGVDLILFVAIYSCCQRLFQFEIREAAEVILQHKRAYLFILAAGVHITNDLYVAHFRPERVIV